MIARRRVMTGMMATILVARATRAAALGHIIGGADDEEPWTLRQDGGLTGIYPRVYAELQKRTGIRIDIVPLPVVREEEALRFGTMDVYFSSQFSKEDLRDFDLGEAVDFYLTVLAGPGQTFASKSDLAGKKIARLRARFGGVDHLEALGAISVPVNTIDSGLRMLVAARVDGFAGSDSTIAWHLKKMGIPRTALGASLEYGIQTARLISNLSLDPALAIALRSALAAMRVDGSIDRIVDDYRPRD